MKWSIAIVALLVWGTTADGQSLQPFGVSRSKMETTLPAPSSDPAAAPDAHRTPRWAKAAVAGAIGGAVGFAMMHWMVSGWNPNGNSMAHDVAIGAFGGAVAFGSATAFYDWICAPGSASDDAGLCTRLPVRRFRDDTRNERMMKHP